MRQQGGNRAAISKRAQEVKQVQLHGPSLSLSLPLSLSPSFITNPCLLVALTVLARRGVLVANKVLGELNRILKAASLGSNRYEELRQSINALALSKRVAKRAEDLAISQG